MEKQEILGEELEVMRAMKVLAKYRAEHKDAGFLRLALLLDALIETTSRKFKCTDCGKEHELYVVL